MSERNDACPLNAVSDPQRLDEVARLRLLTAKDDPVLAAFVTRASRELDLPIALVSIVLNEVQYFPVAEGLGGWLEKVRATPVEWAFCAHAVEAQAPLVVEDATTHPLVRDNPLVTQAGIRCYAGIPLVTSRHQALGTLCVIGTERRTFSAADLERLRELAAEVMQHLESSRPQTAG